MKPLLERLEPRRYFSGAVKTPSTFFPIGVWLQPTSSFSTWKARGINTLVGAESQGGTVSVDTWANAADSAGLYQIRAPRSTISKDKTDANLMAWLQPDEPDVNNLTAQTLKTNYNAWRKVDPNKPIMTNFSGGNLLVGTTPASTYQQKYLPSSDWVGNDFYPVTGWDRPDWIDFSSAANPHLTEGTAVTQFSQISNHKPQFAFIETSKQNLSWTPANTPGVTADQFRGELWDAIIHGARGVIYFPQAFNGFSYDATPASVVAEMTKQDARIQGTIASVLNSASDPTAASLQLTFSNGAHANYLEGAVRPKGPNGDRYFFVLNMSSVALTGQRVDLSNLTAGSSVSVVGESRSVSASSDSLGSYVTDNFAPFALHIYEAAPVAGTISGGPIISGNNNALTTTWGTTIVTAPASLTYNLTTNDLTNWLSGAPANSTTTGGKKDVLNCDD
jgi:hypothetical protein